MDVYHKYIKNQVRELLTNYGTVDIILILPVAKPNFEIPVIELILN